RARRVKSFIAEVAENGRRGRGVNLRFFLRGDCCIHIGFGKSLDLECSVRVRRFVAVFAMVLFALTRLVVFAQNEDRNKDKDAGKKTPAAPPSSRAKKDSKKEQKKEEKKEEAKEEKKGGMTADTFSGLKIGRASCREECRDG